MQRSQIRHAAVLIAAALFAGCATAPAPQPAPACPEPTVCAPCPPCPAAPAAERAPAPAAPLQPARWTDLPGWAQDDAAVALAVFVESCKGLRNKTAWQAVCAMAARTPSASDAARAFFEAQFQPWQVVNPDGGRSGLITGYYEPLLEGSRSRGAAYPHAVFGVPDDLLTIELGDLYPDLKSQRVRGRIDGRKVVPYWSRAEIDLRESQFAGKAIAWVADPVELFFLQIQGSGRIALPDGTRLRVGYADQNGHPYRSIGRWLIERGEMTADQASMEGIKGWARANPQRLSELLNANPSYVFFRELKGEGGPLGALGVPLTEGRSLAIDPRVVPLGAPVYLSTTHPSGGAPLQRLMMAQDTGGAIRGAVRADYFWGFGAEAGRQAGRMRQSGNLWVLLPPEAAPQ
jgi:membrane-bound lytic murein transglycosylase A